MTDAAEPRLVAALADGYRIERKLGARRGAWETRSPETARFPRMSSSRRNMTARVVPLRSGEAGNAEVAGLASERLALVAQLSESSWKLAGRPWPEYTRGTMPVAVTSLKAQTERS